MRGDKGAAEHLGARRVDSLVAHRVLDEHGQPAQRERRRGVRGRQPQPRRQRPAGTHDAAPAARGRTAQLLDLLRTGQRNRLDVLTLGELGEPDRDVELPRHRFIEGQMTLAADLQLVHLDELAVGRASLYRAMLRLEEPEPHPQPGTRTRLEQALGALSPRVRRARNRRLDRWACLHPPARGEHAELPANPVLRGRLPIRVEQVALVEHRVRHRAGRLPALDVGRLTTRRPSIAIDQALPISSG
jgi:hypothetical protein